MAFLNSKKILTILSFIILTVAFTLLILLCHDVFMNPYPTPFAHFLRIIITPFIPLLFPLCLRFFIKIYRYQPREKFPTRLSWLIISGSWVYQDGIRALGNLNKLGSGLNGKGKWGEGVCGVNECTACWVEWLLLVSVVIAEIVTLRWDAGYVEKWVELLAEQAREEKEKLRAEKEAEEMENGEKRQEGVVVEGEYRDEKVERADEDEEVGEEKSG